MIRFGLCCVFREAPIHFRRTTARYLQSLPRRQQLNRLADIARHNADALLQALRYCRDHGIGAFRINSQILPLKTHPSAGYALQDLPGHREIKDLFLQCGAFSRLHRIRTSFHPDQFIVLNSPDPDVRKRSLEELTYQAEVARWVNADVINLHGGGGYGDKRSALDRLTQAIRKLPRAVRQRLTLENDDRVFTPRDLLPVCRQTRTPLVYDVHHHRCLPDDMDEAAATREALNTWSRQPYFHLSSPLHPWGRGDCRPHHDYVDPADFPCAWRDLEITVDIEAKAKELAIARLRKQLNRHPDHRCGP